MSYKEDSKYFKEIGKMKLKCKCGHMQTVFKDKTICDWCGQWVYRNKKLEFREKIKKAMK